MTIRSTLLDRLRFSSIAKDLAYFIRDLIESLLTPEDVVQGGWEDLRFPAQGINPPGAASDPTRDTDDGTLIFSASAENIIAGVAQMSHTRVPGTNISPHFHYESTDSNTGNMVWKLEYKIADVNQNFPADYTVDTIIVANNSEVGKHAIVIDWADIDMSAITGTSAIVKWKISRMGNDPADTYTSTTKFLEFDIHYQRDRFGSANIGSY